MTQVFLGLTFWLAFANLLIMKQHITDFYISPDDPLSKQAILKAALKLFVRDGFNATNIRSIGKEAGYTNPALFKFFKSKEALALHLFELCYLRYANRIAAALRSDLSFDKNLEALVGVFCDVLDENPEAFVFVQDHLREFWPQVSANVRKKSIIVQVRQLLERGAMEKAIQKNISLEMRSAALLGFFIQFARMFYFGEFKESVSERRAEISALAKKIVLS
ncbi:MAG: TetR/AcrR family transcriptional regulator [Bdellovibrionota bacterium]